MWKPALVMCSPLSDQSLMHCVEVCRLALILCDVLNPRTEKCSLRGTISPSSSSLLNLEMLTYASFLSPLMLHDPSNHYSSVL